MSYDPQVSAREKTPFGAFELKASHLKTRSTKVSYATPMHLDRELARAAAIAVICNVERDEVETMLEMLGLIEDAR